jgi:hypothetical protein
MTELNYVVTTVLGADVLTDDISIGRILNVVFGNLWKPDHRKIDKKLRRGNLVKFESQDSMGPK